MESWVYVQIVIIFGLASEDYISSISHSTLHLNHIVTKVDIEVIIINDDNLEKTEKFFISLSSSAGNWSSRMTINQSTVSITIRDDEKIQVSNYNMNWIYIMGKLIGQFIKIGRDKLPVIYLFTHSDNSMKFD